MDDEEYLSVDEDELDSTSTEVSGELREGNIVPTGEMEVENSINPAITHPDPATITLTVEFKDRGTKVGKRGSKNSALKGHQKKDKMLREKKTLK